MPPSSLPPASAAPFFTDGFESGDLSAWTGSSGFTVQQADVGSGSWAGRAASAGGASTAWRTFSGRSEVWGRFTFKVGSRSTALWLASYRKTGGGAILQVGLNKAGKLIVRNVATRTTFRSKVVVGEGWHELGMP